MYSANFKYTLKCTSNWYKLAITSLLFCIVIINYIKCHLVNINMKCQPQESRFLTYMIKTQHILMPKLIVIILCRQNCYFCGQTLYFVEFDIWCTGGANCSNDLFMTLHITSEIFSSTTFKVYFNTLKINQTLSS